MKRRAFLTGTIGTLPFLAGCVGNLPFSSASEGKIIDQKITASSEQYSPTNSSLPVIKFKPDSDQITINAIIPTGRKECTHPAIQNTTYNPQRDSLRVKLGSESDNDLFQFQCPSVAVIGTYNVTLTMRGELPTTVTVDNSRDIMTAHNPHRCKTVSKRVRTALSAGVQMGLTKAAANQTYRGRKQDKQHRNHRPYRSRERRRVTDVPRRSLAHLTVLRGQPCRGWRPHRRSRDENEITDSITGCRSCRITATVTSRYRGVAPPICRGRSPATRGVSTDKEAVSDCSPDYGTDGPYRAQNYSDTSLYLST